MDPQLRWLRRLVVARVAERVTAEAAVVGLIAGVGAAAAGWPPADLIPASFAAVVVFAVVRVGLALSTNPINHRYLLHWTDPAPRLRVITADRPAVTVDDPVAEELRAGGFRYLARLERSDTAATDDGPDPAPTVDLYQADGGRLVVAHGHDGEITVISRLGDGRALVTASSLIPPTERLLVQCSGGQPGQIPTDAVIEHVERLLELRAGGIEAMATDTDDVIALHHAEWMAWQELGPFVGPLVAVGPRRGHRLRLQVNPAAELRRTGRLQRSDSWDRQNRSPAHPRQPATFAEGELGEDLLRRSGS